MQVIKCNSYLVLKLLCPLSISWNGGEVVCSVIVVLVHCVKGMTAVRGGRGKKKRRERQADMEEGRGKKKRWRVGREQDPFPSCFFLCLQFLEVTRFALPLSGLQSEE